MKSALLLDPECDPPPEPRVARMDEVYQVQLQVAKLTSDVEHIKVDVADIKVDLRNLAGRIDAADTRLNGKIDAVDARLHQVDKNLNEKFGSMKVWVLGLYVAQAASLLLVMAKGFKWL